MNRPGRLRVSSLVAGFFVVMTVASPVSAADPAPLELKGLKLGEATPADVRAKFPDTTEYTPETISAWADTNKHCPFPKTDLRASRDQFSKDLDAHSNCVREAVAPYQIAGDKTASASYGFYPIDGTIERAVASFDRDSYRTVRDALKIKYGPPTKTNVARKANKMGATFDSEELTWSRPDGTIYLIELSGDIKTSGLIMSSSKYLQRRRDEEKAKAAAGASKL